jgi:hypothetical protein
MATQRVIGLYVLGILLFVLIIVHQCYSIEGFATKAPPVPGYCGTYGYMTKDAFNPKNIPTNRAYTPSDCESLGGAFRSGWECLKLKKMKQDDEGNYDVSPGNIKFSYSEKCGGLNYQTTSRPSECGLIGRPNVEFSITWRGKKTKILANSFIVYTQDECENQLKGTFVNLQTILDETKKTRKQFIAETGIPINEINRAIKINGGEEMGLCSASDPGTEPNFSLACTGSAGVLSAGGGFISAFFKWLKSIF